MGEGNNGWFVLFTRVTLPPLWIADQVRNDGDCRARARSVFLNEDLQDYDDALHRFHPHL